MFEQLSTSLEGLRRKSLLGSAEEAASYLREVDVEVEEARHDLATAMNGSAMKNSNASMRSI